ncbi:MAG: hypothetical protein EHM16_02665 [Betaproteobacteria bacterium]|nr:MAG: hypothetical protein EHM16_02665 [Betaproteobacteria bacterium]
MQPRAISAAKSLLFFLAILFAAVTQAASPAIKAPQPDTPKRVLFVGNSYFYYNGSLHFHARRIALAADPAWAKPFIYKSATIAAAPLAHHNIEHLITPGNLGVKDPFDMVILQSHSTDAMSEKNSAAFREKAIEFNEKITARGAMTALYMPPAHIKPSKWAASPDMMRRTEALYVSVGNEIGALVIPVGLAFEEAYRRRPDIKLHQDYDGNHPTMLGTYLGACVVYASLYGKSPVGNTYDFHGLVDKDDAAFVQQVADDTVKKFFGR